MRLADFDYELPPSAIAQPPVEPRDAARLLVAGRSGDPISNRHVRDLPELFQDPFLLSNSGRWMASQYDDYGRLTAKGIWASGSSSSLNLQNKIVENVYSPNS